MGVPVITFPGLTFAGRHSFSYLSSIGFEPFVASDWQSYVDVAVHWAGRIDELSEVRQSLRNRMQQSPICQYDAFGSDLLSLLSAKRAIAQDFRTPARAK